MNLGEGLEICLLSWEFGYGPSSLLLRCAPIAVNQHNRGFA